jgi:predicted nuclease of restriction endonuclease-like (RecB) superfamily
LHILSKTKTAEEKEFYLRLAVKERYSVRELERQIDSGYYERTMLSKKKVSAALTRKHPDPEAADAFKDTYVLDFLNLPKLHSEKDLQRSIVSNLRILFLSSAGTLLLSVRNTEFRLGKTHRRGQVLEFIFGNLKYKT